MQVGNEFENKGESITGDEYIANGFNNYFVIVGPSLADNIPLLILSFHGVYQPQLMLKTHCSGIQLQM